jgi:GNAT superfamily N-acetyltransferase
LAELETVNLRERPDLVGQYVELRNSCAELLLTEPVTAEGTKEWLGGGDIVVRALVRRDVLEGAAVLYLGRNGEIAFFVRERGRGRGTRLLEIIEEEARARGEGSVWAWVREENVAARRAFMKREFVLVGERPRRHRGTTLPGVEYRKELDSPLAPDAGPPSGRGAAGRTEERK